MKMTVFKEVTVGLFNVLTFAGPLVAEFLHGMAQLRGALPCRGTKYVVCVGGPILWAWDGPILTRNL